MCKTYRVEIFDTLANLPEDAVNFGTTHFPGHDDGEEVVGSVFHDLYDVEL